MEPTILKVDYKKLAEQFGIEYDRLYNGYVAGQDEALDYFDDVCMEEGSDLKKVVTNFVKYRGDYISSDREAEAFVFALETLGILDQLEAPLKGEEKSQPKTGYVAEIGRYNDGSGQYYVGWKDENGNWHDAGFFTLEDAKRFERKCLDAGIFSQVSENFIAKKNAEIHFSEGQAFERNYKKGEENE